MTKIKVYACYTVKIYKNKPPKHFQTGGALPAGRSWFRLCYLEYQSFFILYICKYSFGAVGTKQPYRYMYYSFIVCCFFLIKLHKALGTIVKFDKVFIISLHTCSWNYFFHHRWLTSINAGASANIWLWGGEKLF